MHQIAKETPSRRVTNIRNKNCDFLDDRHWLQERIEEGEEQKCRQNDRSEHSSVNMPTGRTDQGCTIIRTSIPDSGNS
jgi:hypothetical protein